MRWLVILLLLTHLGSAQTIAQQLQLGTDSLHWPNGRYRSQAITPKNQKKIEKLDSLNISIVDSLYRFLLRHPAFIVEVECNTRHFKGSNVKEYEYQDVLGITVINRLFEKGIVMGRIRLYNHNGHRPLKITDADIAAAKASKNKISKEYKGPAQKYDRVDTLQKK